jgi:hypothetical protein
VSERALLIELVETADTVEPDWQDALRRAGYRGRHFPHTPLPLGRRRVLVLVAAALAVIYVVSAVAADRRPFGLVHQLVDPSGETYAVEQVPELEGWVRRRRAIDEPVMTEQGTMRAVKEVPTIRGSIGADLFEMSAFVSDFRSTFLGRLRVGFSPGGPAEKCPATSCGSDAKVPYFGVGGVGRLNVYGLGEELGLKPLRWVSIAATVGGTLEKTSAGYVGDGPKWFYGVANEKVARVELEDTNDDTVVSVPTFAPPDDFPVRVRFWVAALRLDQLVHTVVPRDKHGEELEHWRLPTAL